jgi:branched-chain amino acid transport system permease protein
MKLPRDAQGFVVYLAGIALALVFAFPNAYVVNLATIICIYAIVSLGLGVLCGLAGQMSMGHAALFGIGAYVTAVAVAQGLGFWPALAIAVLAAALCGFVMGLVSLRFGGIYFAIVTFAFSAVVASVFSSWRSLTGGANGLSANFDPPPWKFGALDLEFSTPAGLLALIAASLLICVLIVVAIERSKFGRACLAIREDELLARCLGIKAFRHKLAAFVISSALAGVAGAWYATYLKYITPELFTVSLSIELLMVLIIGGMLSPIAGPIVGSVVFVCLPEALRFTSGFRSMLFGLLAIVIVLLMPEGLAYGIDKLARRLRRRTARSAESGSPALRIEVGPRMEGQK